MVATPSAAVSPDAVAALLAPRVASILKSAVGGELQAARFRAGMEAGCHCQCHCEGGGHSQTHSQSGNGMTPSDPLAQIVSNPAMH